MKLERVITVFDNKTENLLEEINIDYVDLNDLKRVFAPPVDDPLMYNVYEIKRDLIPAVNLLLRVGINFDLQANTYYVECNQLPPYDFGKQAGSHPD